MKNKFSRVMSLRLSHFIIENVAQLNIFMYFCTLIKKKSTCLLFLLHAKLVR
jgi:hypothetical protein